MQQKPPIQNTFVSLGEFDIKSGDIVSIVVSTEAAGGFAHADAVQILPIK